MAAESVGKHFAAHVRNDRELVCRLVESEPPPITDADVPY
jgi:hypothetical protein